MVFNFAHVKIQEKFQCDTVAAINREVDLWLRNSPD